MDKPVLATIQKTFKAGLSQLPDEGIEQLYRKFQNGNRIILDGTILRGCGENRAG